MAEQAAIRFSDLRQVFRDDDTRLSKALLERWPKVPTKGKDWMTSGLDCAVVLCRSIFSTYQTKYIRKAREDDGPFVQYMFSHFEHYDANYKNRLSESVEAALRDLLGDIRGWSFAHLCRSQAMIDVMWCHPRYHLTMPWILNGPEHAEGGKICKFEEEISSDGILAWDGSSPGTIEELVSSVTVEEKVMDSDNYKLAYFTTPTVLQLDLTQGQDSQCPLSSIWRVWSDIYGMVQTDDNKGKGPCEIQKKVRKLAYLITAIVRHRKDPTGSDSICIWRRNGLEQLPDAPAEMNEVMPD